MPTPQDVMYDEAVAAARSGDRARARDLLARLLKVSQDNAKTWIWMSAVVDTPKERALCLKEALRADPDNADAARGLAVAGAAQPDPRYLLPGRLQKRGWLGKVELPEGELDTPRQRMKPAQMAVIGVVLLAAAGLIVYSIFGMGDRFRRRYVRPIIIMPTSSAVTAAGGEKTPGAGAVTRAGGASAGAETTPHALEGLLKATYTPTPLYVNTPHSSSEAYSIGIRAYQRGELDKARDFLTQALETEPNAADIQYHLGEIDRQQGRMAQAIERYDEAAASDPNFAPAYLGRARARFEQPSNDIAQVMEDLEQALEIDPGYGEAALALADVYVRAGEAGKAADLLRDIAADLTGSPLAYLYRAQANLALGNADLALDDARQANSMDPALLPAYRVMGEALQARGDLPGSLEPLDTYVRYAPEDGEAWLMLAAAQVAAGDRKAALHSLDQAMKRSQASAEALLLRAGLLLEDGKAERALDDYKSVLRSNPGSFEAAMGQARALMDLDYPGDAYTQIERSKILAQTERQKAEWQLWRGRSLEALGETALALRDFRAVVALPAGAVEKEWVQYAQERISALEEKTPIPPVAEPTRQLQRSATPMRTPSPTAARLP